MGASPYKVLHFALGAFNVGQQFQEEVNNPRANMDPFYHGLGDVLNSNLTPESQPTSEHDRLF